MESVTKGRDLMIQITTKGTEDRYQILLSVELSMDPHPQTLVNPHLGVGAEAPKSQCETIASNTHQKKRGRITRRSAEIERPLKKRGFAPARKRELTDGGHTPQSGPTAKTKDIKEEV